MVQEQPSEKRLFELLSLAQERYFDGDIGVEEYVKTVALVLKYREPSHMPYFKMVKTPNKRRLK